MKKQNPKKLVLARETVRALSKAQLDRVNGGSYYPSDAEGCGSDSSDPGGSGGGSGGGGYVGFVP